MIRKISTFAIIVFVASFVLAQDAKQDPPIPADTKTVTTASGLQYSILKKGEGMGSPKMGDSVTCHYRGWLKTGEVFDASYDHPGGAPATFSLGRVIPGWNEGLQLMSPGDTFKFTIPWKLAYGERGSAPKIPAKADLIFVVELQSFKDSGAKLPNFPKLAADDKSITTFENGCRVKTATAPTAKDQKIGEHDAIMVHYTFWNTTGGFIQSSRLGQGGNPASVTTATFKKSLPFFESLSAHARPGGIYNVEVPSAHCFKERGMGPLCPPNSTTIWTIEYGEVIPFAFDPNLELKKTASGLEYEIIRPGKEGGKQPTVANTVKANYCGWTKDGHNFDSSYKRGAPSDFPLGGVVKGWQEGIPLMTEGAIFRFRIPWKDGYGKNGNPRAGIPGECDLIFYVELIEVK